MKEIIDMPEQTDRVIIRQYGCRYHGEFIIAFLPDEPSNFGRIMSYEHIGQHGEASIEFYQNTEATDETSPEAQSLIAELRSIGYNPRIVKRLTRPFGGWAK
jgi:hypothetical protein